ncbi:MAG: hypothetical protein ABIM64_05535 [candidate division WOR-3 bacterium]
MGKKKFKFKAVVFIESEAETLKEGFSKAKKQLEGLDLIEIESVINRRTLQQNAALHLLFTQLAEKLNEKGFDMRKIIRKDVEISWTPHSVKEYLWKPLQKVITGKKSTTKLDKIGEIDTIYDNLNRILIERTKGEVELPPFPSIDVAMDIKK